MKNLSKKKLGVLAALVAVVLSGLAIANPFKSTNLSSLESNREKFDFCDYDEGDWPNQLRNRFPYGIDKSVVDRALLPKGENPDNGYNKGKYNGTVVWGVKSYGVPSECHSELKNGPHWNFVFDPNNKLINIETTLGAKLFPDQVSRKELREKYKD